MPGEVIILNGTSSAGKSSILHAIQEQADYLELGLDKFIFALPKPYLSRYWSEILGAADHAGTKGHQLIHAMHAAIGSVARSGLCVVADHVLVEQSWSTHLAQTLADIPTYLIGVHYSLEVLEQRERARADRTLGQAAKQFGVVHANLTYDCQVYTDQHSADTCARQCLQHIKRHPPHALNRLRTH